VVATNAKAPARTFADHLDTMNTMFAHAQSSSSSLSPAPALGPREWWHASVRLRFHVDLLTDHWSLISGHWSADATRRYAQDQAVRERCSALIDAELNTDRGLLVNESPSDRTFSSVQ
jgi:hypothetical protein